MTFLYDVLSRSVDILAESLVRVNPSIPLSPPVTEDGHVAVYWFTTPRSFVIETLGSHAVTLPLLYYLLRYPWVSAVPARALGLNHPRDRSWREFTLWTLDITCTAFLMFNNIAMLFYKIPTERFWYLLMPCNISSYLLVYLRLAPTDSLHGHIFHFFLSTWYGTVLALMMPDNRGVKLPLEKEVSLIHHYVLIVLPIVWIAQRRYPLYKFSLATTMQCWLVYWLFHTDVLFPVSLMKGYNLGYIITPPQVAALRYFQSYYRIACCLSCFFFTVVSLLIVQAVAWLTGVTVTVPVKGQARLHSLPILPGSDSSNKNK